MAKPIRSLTEARGFDTSAHNLASFGGAGGQHACAIAASLSIQTIIVHRYSSILSAYGMALADVVHEVQEPASGILDDKTMASIDERILSMAAKVEAELTSDGIAKDLIQYEVYLNLRYQGTDNLLMILRPEDGNFREAFVKEHHREFTFSFHGRNILVEDVRVRGIGKSQALPPETPQAEFRSIKTTSKTGETRDDMATVYFAETGSVQTPVFFLGRLEPGDLIQGPAMIIDDTQTIVVEPTARATILKRHVIMTVAPRTQRTTNIADEVDPIRLSIFGHRFMSVAEQMGRMFQKTSVSTNIKERLDFSCALFSPDGKLVSTAELRFSILLCGCKG